MGATNFALRNAKRYFIIEEPEDADYWFWNDAKEDITNIAVNKHGFQYVENDEWPKKIAGKSSIGNDYCTSALPCYIEESFFDKYDNEWRATIVPLVRSGYYQHACLDFFIELNMGNWEDLDNEDAYNAETLKSVIADYLAYQRDIRDEDVQAGEGTELLKNIDEIIANVTNKFYAWAEDTGIDEYAKAWQGSNGEAGYTNLSEIKRKAGKQ